MLCRTQDLESLRSIITRCGGVVPSLEGVSVNTQALELLRAIVAALGGSEPARGHFNDEVIDLLREVHGRTSASRWRTPGLDLVSDPNGYVLSSLVSGGIVTVTLQNSNVAGQLPHQAAVFEGPIQAMLNGALTSDVMFDWLVKLLLEAGSATATNGLILWVGLSDGPVNASNVGIAFGLAGTGTDWTLCRTHNAGAGWVTRVDVSGADDPATKGLIASPVPGSSPGTHASMICHAIDGAVPPALITGSGTNFPSGVVAGVNVGMSRFFVGIGFTGVGDAPTPEYRIGYGHLIENIRGMAGANTV